MTVDNQILANVEPRVAHNEEIVYLRAISKAYYNDHYEETLEEFTSANIDMALDVYNSYRKQKENVKHIDKIKALYDITNYIMDEYIMRNSQ